MNARIERIEIVVSALSVEDAHELLDDVTAGIDGIEDAAATTITTEYEFPYSVTATRKLSVGIPVGSAAGEDLRAA